MRAMAVGFVALWVAFGTWAVEVRPLVKVGYDSGGDTIANATFFNGDNNSMKANEGFYVGGGVAIIDDARNLEYHLTIAYKLDENTNSDTGNTQWKRVPIEGLAFYRFTNLRLGGGLTYHVNPRLEGASTAGPTDVKFKNAFGAVLQAEYVIWKGLAAGLRYTILEYDAKAPASGSAKSNGAGLTARYVF